MDILATTKKKNFKEGFTLVEMLAVLAIFAILSSVILWNHRGFDNTVVLTSLAHDVALSIRQGQVYGISVRGDDTRGGRFNALGYGVHFDLGDRTRYILFADEGNPGDKDYSSNIDTTITTYTLTNGYRIKGIYYTDSSGEHSLGLTKKLSIVFTRPNPTAFFKSDGIIQNWLQVRIEIEPINNPSASRSVVVSRMGQISVKYD